MNITDTKATISKWVQRTDLPPLIMTGAAGIGKTQTVIDICKEAKTHLEIIRVGSLDSPGDLLGLPEIIDGVTTFSKVEMFERLKDGGVLFLDEMNRCKPVLMDSIMQILDQKRLANYDLSHCVIIGAMNPDTDDYSVTEMDKAVVDRCLFIRVSNSTEEVVGYFNESGIDKRIPELTLLAEGELKCNGHYDLPLKELTPRGLRQMASILPITDELPQEPATELIGACIGPKGVAVWKNRAILSEIPTAAAFLENPKKFTTKHIQADGTERETLEMEPLRKRILLRRINSYLAEGKPKVGKDFTDTIMLFGKTSLGYIMRYLNHINVKLNKTNDQYAEMAKEIIEVLK